MSDSEYGDSEYEEETTYVIFDMGHTTTSVFVEEVSTKVGGCRITGLEEGRPFLQLGELTLEGTIDETIGTHLLFEMKDKESNKPLSSIKPLEGKEGKKVLKYECSTETIVTLETVTLAPKNVPLTQSKEGNNDTSIIDAIF